MSSGRCSDTNDVVRVALRRLQDAARCRNSFNATLAETRDEADRDGTFDLESMLAEADAIFVLRSGDHQSLTKAQLDPRARRDLPQSPGSSATIQPRRGHCEMP